MKRLLLPFLFFLPLFAAGQTILQGTVKDFTNNESLIGAFVTVRGLNITAVTNEEGRFKLLIPTSETAVSHILTASHIGYKDALFTVEILPRDEGETLFRDLTLEPDPLTIKNVTVTANRVEEEMQDVPVAISVIDAENMRKRTVANTEQAFEIVPNLVSDAYLPSQATFSLRGLASDFVNLGIENSVGLYIDDVFYSRSFNFNQTLMDIERVEVLRGPQGTLFGKNTIGGVLHVIPEKPKMANFGSVEFNGGSFRLLQVRGKVNTEVIDDKLAVRATGAYRSREGWMLERNEKVRDQNGVKFYGGRISALYKPTDELDILVSGTFTKDSKSDITVDYKVPDDGVNRLPLDSIELEPFDRRVYQNEEDLFFERTNYGAHAKVNYQLNRVHKISSVTAFNGSSSDYLRDFDATSVPAAVVGKEAKLQTFSQEFRLSTPRENRKLFYVFGLYFLRENLQNSDSLIYREAMAPIWESLTGLPVPDTYEESARNLGDITTSSIAAFATTSYEVGERVRVNAGLRFTAEEKTLEYYQRCDCPFDIMSQLVAPTHGSEASPLLREVSDRAVSGNIGMDFKTTDQVLLYVNFSRGFKGSGFNISFSPDPDPAKAGFEFEPENVNNYEVGLKLRANNRIQFNAAAFVTDFKNKQEVVSAGSAIFVSNAESVQGQGFEAEFTGIWTKFFKTEVALGALNMKYQNFPFIDPFTLEEINLSGNRAYKAPDFTLKVAPEFHQALGPELKLMLRFDYNFVGRTYNDIFNTASLARKATGLLNARLNISTTNERFSLGLWGRNLTNENYIQHGWTFVFGDHVAVNPPRMVGVELRANFY